MISLTPIRMRLVSVQASRALFERATVVDRRGDLLAIGDESIRGSTQVAITIVLATRRRRRSNPASMPRKPPVRTQTQAITIRLTPDERQILDQALAKLSEKVRARVPLSRWVLGCAMAEARKLLGTPKK
jgi:hypothetical protein